jgi:hypothetical protein
VGAGGNGVLLSPDLKKMRRLDREVSMIATSVNGEVAVCVDSKGLSTIRLRELEQRPLEEAVSPSKSVELGGVEGMAFAPDGRGVLVTIPGRSKLLLVAIPELETRREWSVDGLVAGQPCIVGREACMPTNSGVAWVHLDTSSIDAVALGAGPKDCVSMGGRVFVAQREAASVEVLE